MTGEQNSQNGHAIPNPSSTAQKYLNIYTFKGFLHKIKGIKTFNHLIQYIVNKKCLQKD